jgi:hypothetical protein
MILFVILKTCTLRAITRHVYHENFVVSYRDVVVCYDKKARAQAESTYTLPATSARYFVLVRQ